jgi:hypothetical protein
LVYEKISAEKPLRYLLRSASLFFGRILKHEWNVLNIFPHLRKCSTLTLSHLSRAFLPINLRWVRGSLLLKTVRSSPELNFVVRNRNFLCTKILKMDRRRPAQTGADRRKPAQTGANRLFSVPPENTHRGARGLDRTSFSFFSLGPSLFSVNLQKNILYLNYANFDAEFN